MQPSATAYILSLAAGILVGVIYGVLKVKSPAPPIIALLGLLGMLAGEQLYTLAKARLFPDRSPPSAALPPE